VLQMCDGYWMMPSQTSGLVQLDPTAWPPFSPDTTPLNYFLWGHVKTVVYSQKPHSLDEHKVRIKNTKFYGVTLKQLCSHGNHVLWMNLR